MLLTAACLATGSLLFVSQNVTADEMSSTTVTKEKTVVKTNSDTSAKTAVKPVLPAGITAKNLNDDKSIEKSFKGVADYAFSTTGFDNIVGYLVDQDRDRIKKSTDKKLGNLDGNDNKSLKDAVAGLEAAWKAKYNNKFDLDIKTAYTNDFIHILTGEVADPSLLVGKWPVGMDNLGGKVSGTDANEAKKAFGGDVNLEKGRNVAIAHIAASHGMPAITSSMIHEVAGGWHFDIPNTMNADMLYSTVVSNLNHMKNNAAKWPADANEGQRAITHAVVSALYGVDLGKLPANTATDR
jgi:hypothetical protein